ncbi:hypothetical protein [Brevundimonas sp.]|jgi:hypothetical protein|uniref:hypothetical protein n=1 Tax=Brevundimonas sp. TaxID=1871086 RepID=UPI002E0E1A7F|nr:hypothetical protein [Brevundimonas sp.]
MRTLVLSLALAAAAGPASPALAQTASQPIAVAVLPLDELRRGQEAYARSTLAAVGDELGLVPGLLPATVERDCAEDRMGLRLDYCVRFYVTRAEPAPGTATVVVAFDDWPAGRDGGRGDGALRVTCFGRGVAAADPAAQDTWLWPDAARMHGMRDLERDRAALADCIRAAASEPFTGLRQPDVD